MDQHGAIQYLNPTAAALLGETDGFVRPEDWPQRFGLYLEDGSRYFPGDKMPPVRALQGENVQAQEMILRRAGDQQETWISMSANTLIGGDGSIEGVLVRVQDLTDRKQIELSRERYARRIETFYRLTRIIGESINDVNQITQGVSQLMAEVLGDLSVVTLLNTLSDKINVAAFYDTNPDARAMFQEVLAATTDFPRNQGLASGVLKSGEPLLVPSISLEQLLAVSRPVFTEFIKRFGIESVLIVPLVGRSGVIGTINLSRHRGAKPYNTTDQSFLMEIAYRTALAIENCLLIESLRTEMFEKTSAKQALDASEERFRAIFESTALGIKVLDPVGTILNTNMAFRAMVGYSEAELTGRNFYDILHPEDAAPALRLFNDLKTGILPDFRFEHRTFHKDGSIVWLRTTFTGVKKSSDDDSLAFIVGILENITHQKQVEAEMAELKMRLNSSLELERLRMAHELHDGPMQELYSVFYRLEDLRLRAQPELGAPLEEANRDVQRIIQDLRATAGELRPPAISDFGLEKAIRSHAEDFREKHPDVQVHLSLAQDRQLLPEEVRLALFRVYQQSMANVIRHAKASEVHVRFSFDAAEARLEISDNGIGFEVPANWLNFVRKGHYGLAGAAERLNALGGVLSVESGPPNPTIVQAVIPLKVSPASSPDADQQTMIKRAKDLI